MVAGRLRAPQGDDYVAMHVTLRASIATAVVMAPAAGCADCDDAEDRREPHPRTVGARDRIWKRTASPGGLSSFRLIRSIVESLSPTVAASAPDDLSLVDRYSAWTRSGIGRLALYCVTVGA